MALLALLAVAAAGPVLVSQPPPPHVINATCAVALDTWCNNVNTNAACISGLEKIFPKTASPLFGLWSGECGSFVGSGTNETCGSSPPKPAAWRCYSHLAVDAQHRWDGKHPSKYWVNLITVTRLHPKLVQKWQNRSKLVVKTTHLALVVQCFDRP